MATATIPQKAETVRNGDVTQVIGYYEIPGSGEFRSVSVTRAASGAFWTTWDGICGGKDFRRRDDAVRFLKRTTEELSVTWFE